MVAAEGRPCGESGGCAFCGFLTEIVITNLRQTKLSPNVWREAPPRRTLTNEHAAASESAEWDTGPRSLFFRERRPAGKTADTHPHSRQSPPLAEQEESPYGAQSGGYTISRPSHKPVVTQAGVCNQFRLGSKGAATCATAHPAPRDPASWRRVSAVATDVSYILLEFGMMGPRNNKHSGQRHFGEMQKVIKCQVLVNSDAESKVN